MATFATFFTLTVGALPEGAAIAASSHNNQVIASIMAVVASALVAWLAAQLRRTRMTLAKAEAALAVASKVDAARDKHLAQQVESNREQLRQAKVDLAAQRKKNHDQAQALRRAEQLARDEAERRVAAQNTRPAFAEIKVAPKQATKPALAPPPAPAKEAVSAADPAANAASFAANKATIAALTAEVDGLKARYAETQARLTSASEAAATHKQSAMRLQRKTEDLRRIDLIGRSKLELLEDKLRALGRQHYEAISELAALKGEVAPPRGRRPSSRNRNTAPTGADSGRGPAARGGSGRHAVQPAAAVQKPRLAEDVPDSSGRSLMATPDPVVGETQH
jgi:hypothetical protein